MKTYLCFKEYEFKMSLEAMKSFDKETGKDLWCTLLTFADSWAKSASLSPITRYKLAYEAVSFETAAHALYCLFKASNKSISFEEVEDGMIRCGWLYAENQDAKAAPYPIVMWDITNQIANYQSENLPKKP